MLWRVIWAGLRYGRWWLAPRSWWWVLEHALIDGALDQAAVWQKTPKIIQFGKGRIKHARS
jgi:hypothetical protein